jgi:hypothetical protein
VFSRTALTQSWRIYPQLAETEQHTQQTVSHISQNILQNSEKRQDERDQDLYFRDEEESLAKFHSWK